MDHCFGARESRADYSTYGRTRGNSLTLIDGSIRRRLFWGLPCRWYRGQQAGGFRCFFSFRAVIGRGARLLWGPSRWDVVPEGSCRHVIIMGFGLNDDCVRHDDGIRRNHWPFCSVCPIFVLVLLGCFIYFCTIDTNYYYNLK